MTLWNFVSEIDRSSSAKTGPYIITDDAVPYNVLMIIRRSNVPAFSLVIEFSYLRNPLKRPQHMALQCMRHVKVHKGALPKLMIGTSDDCIPLYEVKDLCTEEELSILKGKRGRDKAEEAAVSKRARAQNAFCDL